MKRTWIALAVLAAACSRQPRAQSPSEASAAARPAAMAVRTAAAETRAVERTVDVVGSLAADETATVSAEVPGRVTVIRYDFGQSVKKGEVVAELDRRELQLQLERAGAALGQALARIGANPGDEESSPADTPAIRQARAQFEDARSKFESARKLVQSGDIARERFEEIEKSLQSRQAALEAAQDELRTQLANISALRAEKRLAEKRLTDTIVRAPFDGTVAERHVSAGQYIKENLAMLTLVKSWPLRLRVHIPETAAGLLRAGSAARFTTESIPDREFSAVIGEIHPAVDARNRTLVAEARLTAYDARLRPGMFVQVRLTVENRVEIVTVPREAVYTVAGLTKLFTIHEGRAREIRFTPGQTGPSWVEVPGGVVKTGERVAVEKTHQLSDGQEVRSN